MRRLPFLLFGVLGLVVVSGAVSAGSGAPPPAWGPAIEVPGTATLNHGTSWVNSVSCATDGNCAAGGSYGDGAHRTQSFVVDETNGSWGKAIEVPGTATLNRDGFAYVNSVSCPTAGNCAAVGTYKDGSGHSQAFVVDETNGNWGNAIEAPGTATLNGGGDAEVNSVSCATPGDCAAGGYYTDANAKQQAFVVNETDGSWGNATEVGGTAALNTHGDADVESVSCATAGSCTAGGYYTAAHGYAQAFLVEEANGSWGNAIEVPGTATLNVGNAVVVSVSCPTAGNCTAGGAYGDGYDNLQAFVVDETNGSWGNAIEVPRTGTLNTSGYAYVESVSCATAGNCAAGGIVSDTQAFVVDETNGKWKKAIEIPGGADLYSVSCATPGNCTAGGTSWRGEWGRGAFLVDETNGRWGTPFVVRGTATLGHRGSGREPEVNSISCATAADCAAGGSYLQGSRYQTFVVSSTPASSLNAGGTNCDGPYAGTGDHVVVPAGSTCTLVPGTHVSGNVTVSTGGKLDATGVKIGGVLKIAGSATVCRSTVRGDVTVVSAGGSLDLGGVSACIRSNTFLSNVLIKNDRHVVRIRGNTIAGNLVFLNSHGKGDSIRDNTVGNLAVAHSGPVWVIENHAKGTIRCTANTPQNGYGNKARGKNTCPE